MSVWSWFRAVSQYSLKACRLEFEDRPLEQASLFPLFDQAGRTRVVMITATESTRIMLADWAPGLFAGDWRWRNRLRLRLTDLNDASKWDENRFEDLWHIDPWWVLRDERYQGHGALPGLQSTNVPGYDATVSGAVFSADLERASHMMTGSGESMKVRRFRPDTLAAIARRRRTAHERQRTPAVLGWRLRPFWRFP